MDSCSKSSSNAVRMLGICVAAAAILCSACASAPAEDDPMGIAKAFAVKYEAAVAAKDAPAISNLFTPEGVFQNVLGVFKGRSAIQGLREAGFKRGLVKEALFVTDAHRVGNVIIERGDNILYLASNGSTTEVKGRWAGVLLKSGNEWQLDAVTAIVVPAPPPKP